LIIVHEKWPVDYRNDWPAIIRFRWPSITVIDNRKAEPVVPPIVTYSLTRSGELLTPILDAMVLWARVESSQF
ncbi:hypothetical protein ACVWYN_003447, partial [Pedobacter sp. UYP24]